MSFVIYGSYGAGKTTFIEELAKWTPFRMCIMTTSRLPRKDDTAPFFEYLDEQAVQIADKRGEFALLAKTNETFYGYRKSHIGDTRQVNLLYGNPEFTLGNLNSKVVEILIDGDSKRGLMLRGDKTLAKQRETARRQLDFHFFQNRHFRQRMDLIVENHHFRGTSWKAAYSQWCRQIATRGLVRLWTKCALEKDSQKAALLSFYYTHLSTRFPKCEQLAANWGRKALYWGYSLPMEKTILTWKSSQLGIDTDSSPHLAVSAESQTCEQL